MGCDWALSSRGLGPAKTVGSFSTSGSCASIRRIFAPKQTGIICKSPSLAVCVSGCLFVILLRSAFIVAQLRAGLYYTINNNTKSNHQKSPGRSDTLATSSCLRSSASRISHLCPRRSNMLVLCGHPSRNKRRPEAARAGGEQLFPAVGKERSARRA